MPLLDEETIYFAGMIGCLEAIRSGTTTLVDFMYANVRPEMTDAILQAFNDCGIRGVLAYGINDREYLPGSSAPAFSFDTVGNRIAEMERLKSEYQSHSRSFLSSLWLWHNYVSMLPIHAMNII